MVNIDDFVKRLEILLDYYNLNASSFADKIGVQRSSLSHLLSGRNKPSLDFILKILDVFPDVDLYWILNGKGSFPKTSNTDFVASRNPETTPSTPLKSEVVAENLFSGSIESERPIVTDQKKNKEQVPPSLSVTSEVEKIVFFYKDGTFKEFNPH